MDQRDKRLENMLFNDLTLTKTDFHKKEIKQYNPTVFFEKPYKKSCRKGYVSKNIETTGEYKKQIPFSLFIKKNPILHKDPREIQHPVVKETDIEKTEIIRTRPRVALSPAVCIDDMADLNAREWLVQDMYKSTVFKAQQETAAVAFPSCRGLRAPLCEKPAPAQPVNLPRLDHPYVSPEWRPESLTWEGRQYRGECSATQEFWTRRSIEKNI